MNYDQDYRKKEAASIAAASQLGGIGGMQNQTQGPESQIQSSARRHGESLNRLHERLNILCERLSPLLRPAAPTPSSQMVGQNPATPQAPFASALNQITDQMDNLNFMVEDVLNRIEL